MGRDKVFDDFNENSMFYCDKAASWFEKAANNNHIEAIRQLSLMHRGNMFSKADEKESVELTKKLAYTLIEERTQQNHRARMTCSAG